MAALEEGVAGSGVIAKFRRSIDTPEAMTL
jgi:hypothetical protein